ncbi:MAG: SDR family oxidoreductase [Opitutaceae bacterium]|jgi:NAD(P)-dependent dehydrogenase (short-subunit alcohol dehydrogenase family)|nr:SDR family oxidoreductase [Opitutaceae bacterium]
MSINQLFNLRGKTALITGGSRGIGRAVTLALAENGANVIINYRDRGLDARAEKTAAEAAAFGARATLWPFDLESDGVGHALLGFANANKCPPDILVTNASLQIRKEWDEITSDEFARQINTNLRSTLQLIQAVVPRMRQNRWGRILNIGSVQQMRPHPQMCVYAASKSALVNLVKNLAPRLAASGITINNLAPGTIATDRNEPALADAEYKKTVLARIPLGFVGQPDDCAALALLLCSDAGRYITGADYLVDGGMGLCF